MLRQSPIAGDQVGFHIRVGAVEAGKQPLQQMALPAFHQQYAGEGRNTSAKKIAQLLLFHAGQDSVLSYSKKAETGVENPGINGSSIV
jgi:hypothetical protein